MVAALFGGLADHARFKLEDDAGPGGWQAVGLWRDTIPPHQLVWVRV